MDVVTVYPLEGEFPRIARALLDAAENPRQVNYVSSPQAGFVVPAGVFERFQLMQENAEPENVTQQPKRRGRPRKSPQPQTGEEE